MTFASRTSLAGLRRLLAALLGFHSAEAGAQAPAPVQTPAPAPSATIPAPREGGPLKMHERFLERAKSPVDLLFLGDSITQGWASKDKEGHGALEVWDRYYAPRNAANFGIGGDRTQHILWRLDNGEVEGITPAVVVLMIGTNNVGSNTAEEIAQGVEAIVAKLKDKLPSSKILLLGVFPRNEKPSPAREKLKAVNAIIAKLDDGKGVKFLDISEKFLEPDGTISKEVMPDFLHLSRKGYRIWADAMEPTLWDILGGR